MGSVETFDHTADLGLRVTGEDLDDLFRTAAEGLFDVIAANRTAAVRPDQVETVALKADSTADLFLAWLNELIFRCETQHRLYRDFTVQVEEDAEADDGMGAAGARLTATLAGEPIDRNRHVLDHEVKAATLHGFALERTAAGWAAAVILDI